MNDPYNQTRLDESQIPEDADLSQLYPEQFKAYENEESDEEFMDDEVF